MTSREAWVSVVLPTYNRAQELPRAIRSVLEQTWKSLELVVVDDGSTDDTEQVVREFDDPRIRYIRHETNRGGSAARNTGGRASSHPFVAFQDSDDEWLADKLQRQMELFLEAPPEVGVVFCGYLRMRDDGEPEYFPPRHLPSREGRIHRALLHGSFLGTPTIVARRSCLDEVGWFDEELPRFQDWELMIRLSERWSVRLIDEPLVRAYFAAGNITDGHSASLEEAERHILDKHRETFRKAGDDVLAYRLGHLAHILLMRDKGAEGRALLRESLRLSMKLSRLVLLALSFHPGLYRRCYRLWARG